MKKTGITFFAFIAGMMAVTGCSDSKVASTPTDPDAYVYSSAQELANDIDNAMKNVSSFSINEFFNIDAILNMYGQSTDMKQKGEGSGEIQIDPEYAHLNLDLTSSSGGSSQKVHSETYVSGTGSDTRAYIRTNDGGWQKDPSVTGIEFDTLLEQFMGKKIIQSILYGETVASIDNNGGQVNGRDTYKITAKVSGDIAGTALNDALGNLQISTGDWSSLSTDMDIYIYKNEKLPAKIAISGGEFLEGVMAQMGYDCTVKEYKGEFTLDNYTMGAIGALEIPDEVKSESGDSMSDKFKNLDSTANMEMAADDYNDFYMHTAEVYKKYVQLGDYKGIKVNQVDRSNEEISEENVESTLRSLATEFKSEEDVTEGGTTQKNDEIVLDFTGTIDGKEFEGGSSTDYSYTIGSGNFIEDLDKGLEGKEANKEYDINVKFPDDYGKEELKGKDAVFKVTIKKIIRPTVPEINDEFAKAHNNDWELKGYGSDIKTIDKLKEGIKNNLAETQKAKNDQTLYGEVLDKIIENSEFKKDLPQEELNYLKETMKSNAKSEFESYGSARGIESYDDYIKQYYGYDSEAAFGEYVQTQTEDYLKAKMITTIIAYDNGVKVSYYDIRKYGENLATEYGYSSYKELVGQYGKILNCESGYSVLYEKVAAIVAATSSGN